MRESVQDQLDPQALELWGLEPRERYTRRRRVILWASLAAAVVGVIAIVQLTRSTRAASIREIVRQAAHGEGLDPLLVEAVVRAESGGNPQARSRAGAVGLMQLMPKTASSLADRPVTVPELYDPRFNARLGCAYLKYLLKHYDGDVVYALMAYNAGMGRVAKWRKLDNDARTVLDKHAFRETRAYVYKVLRVWDQLKEADG